MAGSPKKKSAKAGGTSKTKAPKAPAAAPAERRPSLVGEAPSADFEAGLLFERFSGGGLGGGTNAAGGRLDALSFQKMWRERDKLQQLRRALAPPSAAGGGIPPALAPGGVGTAMMPPPVFAVPPTSEHPGVPLSFEAGQLFERFDGDHDGRLSRSEFEGLLNEYLRNKTQQATANNKNGSSMPVAPPPAPSYPAPPASSSSLPAGLPPPPTAPTAAGSSSSSSPALPPSAAFTHYDETSGLPLPSDAVYRYGSLYGHKVVPLAEAYHRRMHRLQSLLTSHVLPKREQLLQLARRVKVVEDEVRAARLSIERETQADTAAVLERLRSAEALKLSSLDHRMTQVASQLDAIDRLLAKVGAKKDGGALLGASEGGGPDQAHMVEVVQSYPELCAAMERIHTTTTTGHTHHQGANSSSGGGQGGGGGGGLDVGVSAHDLRRETAERVEVLRRCDRYEEALAVKDQMVWSLCQEKERLSGLLSAEEGLRRDYSREVEEWASLTAALSQELAKVKGQLAGQAALVEEAARLRREKEALVAELLAAKTTTTAATGAGGGGRPGGQQQPGGTSHAKAEA